MTVKEQIIQAMGQLPEDATIDDAMERLFLLYKVERRVSQANSGQQVSQEEARQRMARWLK